MKVIPETLRAHKIRPILIIFGIFSISLLLFGLIVVHDQQNIFIFYYIFLYFLVRSALLFMFINHSIFMHRSFSKKK